MTKNETRKIRPFESGQTRAQWVIVSLIILIIVNIIAIASDYSQVQLIERVLNGQTVTIAEGTANDDRQLLIWGIQLLFTIIYSIFLLMWIHRVYRNLPSLGSDNLHFSPGWAVGGFFIPLWNLIHPFLVMSGIWKASDPLNNLNDKHAWKYAPLSFLVPIWGFLLLVSWLIGTIVDRLNIDAFSLEDFLTYGWAVLALDGLSLLFAVVTIKLVWDIHLRQKERNSLILKLSGNSFKGLDRTGHEARVEQQPPVSHGIIIENGNNVDQKVICNKCGGRIEKGDVYCRKCGNDFEEESLHKPEDSKIIFDENKQYLYYRPHNCPYCNSISISESIIQATQSEKESKLLGYSYLWEGKCASCSKSWYSVEGGKQVSVHKEPIAVDEKKTIDIETETNYCYKCGREITSEMAFCPKCGHKL